MGRVDTARTAALHEVKAALEERAQEQTMQSNVLVQKDGKIFLTSVAAAPGSAAMVPAKKKKKQSIIGHAISGSCGAVMAETLLFPVDTIKIQAQTYTGEGAGGVVSTALRIIREKGWGGFYAGFQGAVVKESIHSMNFWIFHGMIFRLASRGGDGADTPLTQRLLLNLVAKQMNWLCTVPFEVVSSVNQITKDSPGLLATAMMLYKQNGLGGFYRGLGVSLLLAINPAIMNTFVTTFCLLFKKLRRLRGETVNDKEEDSAAAVGLATGLSKTLATVLTYPLIRAKVLQQTQLSGKALTLPKIIKTTLANEGVSGLYRGILAMSFKTVLWNALMMAFKKLLDPKKAITPQPTPPGLKGAAGGLMTPLLAREPFPAELVTAERLREMLHVWQTETDGHIGPTANRVEALEQHVSGLADELKELNKLVSELVKQT